ncbi:hypothetical protein [Ralstonia sp. ASV6]|uniref:hypothetical protein n=1 Tax=Ralstonia sp. ASV6 TaxID=2795124 RepID=UPI0018EB9D36|nr:hypothetical protein [Ralstonia sp. ASV6]
MPNFLASLFGRRSPAPAEPVAKEPELNPLAPDNRVMWALAECGEDPTISRITEIRGKLHLAKQAVPALNANELADAIKSIQAQEARAIPGSQALSQALLNGRNFSLAWTQTRDESLLTATIQRRGTDITLTAQRLAIMPYGTIEDAACVLTVSGGPLSKEAIDVTGIPVQFL